MSFMVEEVIAAPTGLVWKHLSDPTGMSRWMAGIEAMRSADGKPLATGSELIFTARGAERSSRVLECRRGEVLVLQSVQGRVTATYRYRLEDQGEATRVSLQADCVATGWVRLVAPLIGVLMRRADSSQLAALKEAVLTAKC